MPGFTDRWIVALAAATGLGAWIGIVTARELGGDAGAGGLGPVVIALAVTGVALVARRPVLLCLALAVLAATLAQRSLDGLHPPHLGAVRAEVTLLGDPAPTAGGGVRVDARLDGKRLAASAHRAAAAALDDRLAGERVLVVGTVTRPGPYEQRMLHRHLAGRLQVDVVAGWRPGDGVSRLANGLRHTLETGASSLASRPQALLMGLVLGDDRDHPADLTDAFQAAGLVHLTAVSGQNVSFVLLLVHPLLVRLRFAPRLLLALAVLAGFALLTRFEPSVLRATAMASIGAFGAAVGRPSNGLRRLGFAVTGLLLCDPLLVMSLGFRLSVAGAAGIIVAAAPIERCLPGPRWVAAPLAVTGAAQLAVAPLLVQSFGTVSLVSLPANLLAVPAAGPVMMWGLTAGLVAGVLGGPAAAVLHLPSRLLLGWIEAVALAAATRPIGLLHTGHVAALLAAVALALTSTRLRHWALPSVGSGRGATPGSPASPAAASGALTVVGWSEADGGRWAATTVAGVADGADLQPVVGRPEASPSELLASRLRHPSSVDLGQEPTPGSLGADPAGPGAPTAGGWGEAGNAHRASTTADAPAGADPAVRPPGALPPELVASRLRHPSCVGLGRGGIAGRDVAAAAGGAIGAEAGVALPGRGWVLVVAGVLRWVAALGATAVLVAAVVDVRPPGAGSAGPTPVGPGAVLWRGGGVAVVVIDGRATEDGLLSSLRSAGVGRVDVIVVRTTADRAVAVAARARRRWPGLVLLAPIDVAGLPGALTPAPGSVMDVGPLRLRFDASADHLEPSISVAERPP